MRGPQPPRRPNSPSPKLPRSQKSQIQNAQRNQTWWTGSSPAVSLAGVEGIEQQAETVLAAVPDWIWNGEELPVPVENIADSCFGLLIRDAEDMTAAPGAPQLRD